MNKSDNWAVALVHEHCPICFSKVNEQILIPNKLSKKVAKEIEEANGKSIGISNDICEECKKLKEEGYIALVGIDPDKSDMSSRETIFYTGSLARVRTETMNHLFKDWEKSDLGGYMYVEQQVLIDLEKLVNREN